MDSEKRCFRYFKDTKMKANHNTEETKYFRDRRCFRYFKDTKMKANHNGRASCCSFLPDVSDTSKILKWKQITTHLFYFTFRLWCFRYFKDTKMKANHNGNDKPLWNAKDVSDTSKILKWKQITTISRCINFKFRMFPILQRY